MWAPLRIGLAVCILFVTPAPGQSTDEYQVKAGFVSGFASFVEWPSETFSGPREPLAICVLGRNPFGASLDAFVEKKVVDGRPLAVRLIADVREAEGCQIVFVSSSEHLRLKSILASLRGQSVLSVGDTPDFIAEGGIVNLRIQNGKVRIEINEDAAKARHLRVSSRLLQLARSVTK